MKRSSIVVAFVALALTTLPARAGTEIVIAGEAITSSGGCLALEGISSGATGRSRWASGYWERISTPPPLCSDTDPHFDPAITCVQAVTVGTPGSPGNATIAYIAATGPSRSSYLFKIVDRPDGVDEIGVLAAPIGSGPCGAGAVVSSPVAMGGFVIGTA